MLPFSLINSLLCLHNDLRKEAIITGINEPLILYCNIVAEVCILLINILDDTSVWKIVY